ncbi:hypothetical protein VTJ83DRAFT_7081 [Remersonia thermophila]|uniref:Uncharacterized protein n=1 Tax=Remersonia thermophila TaxID=72144 RepID=A0ABR4D2G3_9PEZI
MGARAARPARKEAPCSPWDRGETMFFRASVRRGCGLTVHASACPRGRRHQVHGSCARRHQEQTASSPAMLAIATRPVPTIATESFWLWYVVTMPVRSTSQAFPRPRPQCHVRAGGIMELQTEPCVQQPEAALSSKTREGKPIHPKSGMVLGQEKQCR